MGLHLGAGSTLFGGTLADHYSSGTLANYGFDLSYKSAVLMLEIGLGGSDLKKQHGEPGIWTDRSSDLATADLSIGYLIINDPKWRVTPF